MEDQNMPKQILSLQNKYEKFELLWLMEIQL